jgi:uncharacterized protein YecT (DUF1311 family)
MNECYAQMVKKSEKELDELYKKLEKGIENKARLNRARKAWLAYRKAECDLDSHGFITGSIYPTIYAICLENLTQQQINTVKNQIYCEEGDITCGAN